MVALPTTMVACGGGHEHAAIAEQGVKGDEILPRSHAAGGRAQQQPRRSLIGATDALASEEGAHLGGVKLEVDYALDEDVRQRRSAVSVRFGELCGGLIIGQVSKEFVDLPPAVVDVAEQLFARVRGRDDVGFFVARRERGWRCPISLQGGQVEVGEPERVGGGSPHGRHGLELAFTDRWVIERLPVTIRRRPRPLVGLLYLVDACFPQLIWTTAQDDGHVVEG